MRLKKPTRAIIDQVRIRREGNDAIRAVGRPTEARLRAAFSHFARISARLPSTSFRRGNKDVDKRLKS